MQNNIRFIILFSAVFILHVGVILGLQVFNPFATITDKSPDYVEYSGQAKAIAHRLSEGKFSLKDMAPDLPPEMGVDLPDHYYPVIIGYLLFLFGGSPMLIGQIFNAIIAGLCAILLFIIMRLLGAGEKISFIFSFAGSIIPTWLLISSLFHEDALVVLLVLTALLAGIKTIQSFTWKNIFIWYALVIAAAEFRSFMGVILGVSFLLSYIFLHPAGKEEKIKNSVRIALLVFFVSFAAEAIYRATGLMAHGHSIEWIFQIGYTKNPLYHYSPDLWNFEGWFSGAWYSGILSIIYSSLMALAGPFPWSLKYPKGFIYLAEAIPWLLILPLIFRGVGRAWEKFKPALYLAIFAAVQLLLIALYVETREPEVMMRLRIPAFLSLIVFSSLAFPEKIPQVSALVKVFTNEWKKIIKYII